MKKFWALLIPIVIAAACNDKDIITPQHPQMKYTALNNIAIKFGQQKSLDIDGENGIDLVFSTLRVGDPVLRRDRMQYYVNATYDVFSLVNSQEQTPALNAGDNITITNHPGYTWFNASSIVLAEKIIEETGPDHWEGNWKDADHKYIPVQIRKNDLRYNGWVEASFKTNTQELILHRAAISMAPGKDIRAGY